MQTYNKGKIKVKYIIFDYKLSGKDSHAFSIQLLPKKQKPALCRFLFLYRHHSSSEKGSHFFLKAQKQYIILYNNKCEICHIMTNPVRGLKNRLCNKFFKITFY